MYWIGLIQTKVETPYGDFIKFWGKEIRHQRHYWVYIKIQDCKANKFGRYSITKLSEYSDDVKDFLLKGIAPLKIDIETGAMVVKRKVFITNSTANSVVFYAMTYLNNNFSLSEIRDLRTIHSFNDFILNFEFDELKKSFVEQSDSFLKLYRVLRENDRFEQYIDNILSDEEKFKSIFSSHYDRLELKRNYHRKVYHEKLECEFMRKDYDVENVFHANTGMFAEKLALHSSGVYSLDDKYLSELGMRPCQACFI